MPAIGFSFVCPAHKSLTEMKVITSRDNSIYKSAQRLLRKKYRDEQGMYLMEGVKPLRDAIDTGIGIEKVFICEGTGAEKELAGWTDAEDRQVFLSRSLFDKLSETETSQGIIAVARKNQPDEEAFAKASEGKGLIVLDRLQDPGNLGTIIRTAEAAGYGGLILVKGSADSYAPKVVRAAAGSLFRMPILQVQSAEETIKLLRKLGRRIVVTYLEGGLNCFDAELRPADAIVIGNEGQGVSQDFADAADVRVIIPMEGQIESLNAAVAAGILMYISTNKR